MSKECGDRRITSGSRLEKKRVYIWRKQKKGKTLEENGQKTVLFEEMALKQLGALKKFFSTPPQMFLLLTLMRQRSI